MEIWISSNVNKHGVHISFSVSGRQTHLLCCFSRQHVESTGSWRFVLWNQATWLLVCLFFKGIHSLQVCRSVGSRMLFFCFFFQNTLFTFKHLEKLPRIINVMTFLSVVNPVSKRNHLFEALVLMQFTGYLNIETTETNTVICVYRPVCP